jgi:hypothetical protein
MTRLPHIILASGLTLSLALVACGDAEQNEDTSGTGDGDAGDGDGDTGDGDGDTGNCANPSDSSAEIEAVTGNIDADTTWTCDKIYRLAPDTHIFVNGATLTIEPGTTIQGLSGSALVIEKDAKLMASGTADAPIVFTSNQDSPAPGDWGGIVFLGEAVINLDGGIGQAEGFPTAPTYGGDDPAHDCGTLEYARVEYAGFAISDGNELNGITFYACGTDTTVNHVQSHMGLDDGIEWFGGGFDANHIVVTGANDDSLDIDQGFGGTLQYVFIQQDPGVGDNGFEISNQGSIFDAEPLTSPTICNATVIGSGSGGDKSKGFTLKEGTEVSLHNMIFTNATNEAALLADEVTWEVLDAGGIAIANNIFFANGPTEFRSGANSLDDAGWEAWLLDATNMNLQDDPGLASTAWGSPDISPSDTVAGVGEAGPGCEAADYIGAVDPAGDNWTAEGWIRYAG